MKNYFKTLEIKSSNSQNQIMGLSLLRILATFSVIIIHVSAFLLHKYGEISLFDWNIGNFFDSASRYSVPMFFMISGALLLKKDYSLKQFLSKRFLKILPPFIFWSLVYSIVKRYAFGSELFSFIASIDKIIRDVFYGSEYHLWFIYVLLGIYLIVPVIRKWVKNASQKEILFFLIIWLFTIIYDIPGLNIYFPKIELMYFSGYLGYFVLGYYLSNLNLKKKLFPILLVIFGVSITIIGTHYFTVKNNKFFYYFYDYLTLNTLMVSIGLFLLLKNVSIKNVKLKYILLKLNESCFGIYLIHALILSLFDLFGINYYMLTPIISIPLVSFMCLICSFIIIHFVKKLNYGKLIVG